MDIICKVVDPSEMRPEVDGSDWFFDKDGNLQVRICPMADKKHEILLQIHEIYEAVLCRFNGVTVAQVDAFDTEYDRTHSTDLNAGDDPQCPYQREHTLATAAERVMAAELKVNWFLYDKALSTDYPGPSKKATKNNAPPPVEL